MKKIYKKIAIMLLIVFIININFYSINKVKANPISPLNTSYRSFSAKAVATILVLLGVSGIGAYTIDNLYNIAKDFLEKNKDLSSKINDNGTIDLDDDFINKVNNYKSGLDSGTEQILINNYIWPLYFQYDNNFNFNSNKPPQIKLSNILTKGHYKLSATVEITDYCYDYNFTSANFGISIMYSDSYSKLQTSYSKFYPINLNYKANTYRNFTYYIETDDLYFDGSKLYYGATSLDTNGIIYVRAYMEKSKIYNCKIKDMTFFRNKTMVKGQHYFIDNNKSIENLDRGYYKAIVENQEDLLAVNNDMLEKMSTISYQLALLNEGISQTYSNLYSYFTSTYVELVNSIKNEIIEIKDKVIKILDKPNGAGINIEIEDNKLIQPNENELELKNERQIINPNLEDFNINYERQNIKKFRIPFLSSILALIYALIVMLGKIFKLLANLYFIEPINIDTNISYGLNYIKNLNINGITLGGMVTAISSFILIILAYKNIKRAIK